jgi:hypothetical protein
MVADSDNGQGAEGMVIVHQVAGNLGQHPRLPGPPPPPWEHPAHRDRWVKP